MNYIAGLMEEGALDPDDHRRLYDILAAGLAATQQVQAVLYIDARGWMMVASRAPDGTIGRRFESWQNDPQIAEAMAAAAARESNAAFWGAPVFAEDAGTVLNLRRPVRRGGPARHGGGWPRPSRELSEFVAGLESESGQNAFILYDREHVLAHTALIQDFEGLGPDRPLPRVTEVGDPVLFGIWNEGWQQRRLEIGVGHQSTFGGDDYIFLYAPLAATPTCPGWSAAIFARRRSAAS